MRTASEITTMKDAPRRRFSLSIYISILLVITAILPLIATIGSIEIFLQPALISQISADMERDAQTRIQVIDTYLAERLNDIKTLSESAALKALLAGDAASTTTASDLLYTAFHRDVSDYVSISLLDTNQNVKLWYPTNPQKHGNYLVQPEALNTLQTSEKVVLSDVFYDPVANNPSVDIYARVVDDTFQTLGFVRASLGLHRLWEPVDAEPQANGTSSYAFVLDQHGVRIAYTNPDHSGFTRPQYLFKSIAPLSATFQQQIKNEVLYGNDVAPVTDADDSTLASLQSNTTSPQIFQFTPAGQDQTYEAARSTSAVINWTYVIVKPLSVVTGLANEQLLTIILIVAALLVVVVLVGIQFGRRITLPIMRSVVSLRKNSLALKTLADEEQVVATEQSWMVEASDTALQSIKYYTHASGVAAQRLTALCAELRQPSGTVSRTRINQAFTEMTEAARYIEQAIKHQENANEKLASALRVTTQATNQLTEGARSTDDAAAQLEYIVQQLMAVVGEQNRSSNETQAPGQ